MSNPVSTYTLTYNGSTNKVTTSAWKEIVSASTFRSKTVELFDSSGEILEFGYGPSGGEVRAFLVPRGGNTPFVAQLLITEGMRLCFRAVSDDIEAGEITITFYN